MKNRILGLWFGFLVLLNAVSAQGPTPPEYTSFTPISSSDMVDPFTGNLNYQIQLFTLTSSDGMSYPIVIGYNSDNSPNSEASWVGYGWSLNPGAITRQLKGLPDEFRGETVKYWNKAPSNWTVSVSLIADPEIWSSKWVSLGLTPMTMTYNSTKGFNLVAGINFDLFGLATLTFDEDNASFSPQINIFDLLEKHRHANSKQNKNHYQLSFLERYVTNDLVSSLVPNFRNLYTQGVYTAFGLDSRAYSQFPTNVTEYTGVSVTGEFSVEGDVFMQVGGSIGVRGQFNEQTPRELVEKKAYGYFYTGEANEEDVTDYYLENDAAYSNRNIYMGIPFSNADNFMVTGPGIGGSFRGYNTSIGTYSPNKSTSSTIISDIGAEITLGANFGVGGTGNVGEQSNTVGRWDFDDSHLYKFNTMAPTDSKKPIVFRMYNDMAGSLQYTDDISLGNVPQLSLTPTNLFRTDYKPNVNSLYPSENGSINKINESAYNAVADIRYLTYGEYRKGLKHYNLYELQTTFSDDLADGYGASQYQLYDGTNYSDAVYHHQISSYAKLDRDNQPDFPNGIKDHHIVEYSIKDGSGKTFNYGLPVFSRKEANLSIDVSSSLYTLANESSKDVIWQDKNDNNNNTKVGQEVESPYASSFLLTSVTTPDYVDRLNDGPTDDDFGSWLKYSYRRSDKQKTAAEEHGRWFKWRQPYTGYFFQRNSLSDPHDDLATYSRGERQQYYLKSIETKDQIAYFITNKTNLTIEIGGNSLTLTGSGDVREDNFESPSEIPFDNTNHDFVDIFASITPYSSITDYPTNNDSEYLERIVIFSKDKTKKSKSEIRNGTDIFAASHLATVFFEYAESGEEVWPNQPSSKDGRGKLTLKKVWTEYNNERITEGIELSTNSSTEKDQYISPYQFSYVYDKPNEPGLAEHYTDDIYTDNETYSTTEATFSTYQADRWGYFQDQTDAETRHSNGNEWVTQNPGETFDPAAWSLKKIETPGGGEIRIQYEQDEYVNVQDKYPMMMVPLSYYDHGGAFDPHLEISQDDLPPGVNLTEYAAFLRKELVTKHQKVQFKFLYALLGTTPYRGNCNSEVIKGYVGVENVFELSGKIQINFSKDVPDEICEEFYAAERKGMYETDNDCEPGNGKFDRGNRRNMFRSLISRVADIATWGLNRCLGLNLDQSFVRLPMMTPKKGGGTRVKKILNVDRFAYDEGESTTVDVYGKEYLYITKDGECSGVATNEPTAGKDENATVTALKKHNSNLMDKFKEFTQGGDILNQTEGPIAQSIYPGASVGYSSVYVKNIYEGSSSEGFIHHEYYTSKDTPVDGTFELNGQKYNKISVSKIKDKDIWPVALGISFFDYSFTELFRTQSNRFINYDLHGKPKQTTNYGGKLSYSGGILSGQETWYESSKEVYDYFSLGEKIPVYNGIDDYSLEYPGLTQEFNLFSRTVSDVTGSGALSYDATLFLAGVVPLPSLSGLPGGNFSERHMNSFMTSELIDYPVVLKSKTVYKDGASVKTENIAFCKYNGEPIITNTYDDFHNQELISESGIPHNGIYYNLSESAPYKYSAMRNSSTLFRDRDYQFSFLNKTSSDDLFLYMPSLNGSGNSGCANSTIPVGSLLKLDVAVNEPNLGFSRGKRSYVYGIVEGINGSTLKIKNLNTYNESVELALDATNIVTLVHVLNSGNTNTLSQPLFNLTTYGNAIESISGTDLPLPRYDPIESPVPNPALSYEIDARTVFADDLNNMILGLIGMSGSVTNSVAYPDISMKNNFDGCNTVEQSSILLESDYDPNSDVTHMTLSVGSETPVVFDFGTTTIPHPLVIDLNRWLNNVWTMEISDLVQDHRNSTSIHTKISTSASTYTFLHSTHTYWDRCPEYHQYNSMYDGGLNRWDDTEVGREASFNDKLMERSGLTEILNKYYDINGQLLQGKDIIRPIPCDVHTDFSQYALGRVDASGVKYYYGHTELSFIAKDYDDGYLDANGNFNDAHYFGIRRHPARYNQHCNRDWGNRYNCWQQDGPNYHWVANQEGEYMSNFSDAWVDLPGRGPNSPGYVNYYFTNSGASSQEDYNNQMWSDMFPGGDIENTVFTETHGKFDIDMDGDLVFVPNSSSPFYNSSNDDPIKIQRIIDPGNSGNFTLKIVDRNCKVEFDIPSGFDPLNTDVVSYEVLSDELVFNEDDDINDQEVKLLNLSGNYGGDCETCWKFCKELPKDMMVHNVISSSLVTYSQDSTSADYNKFKIEDYSGNSDYEIGVKGKWRPTAEHIYYSLQDASSFNNFSKGKMLEYHLPSISDMSLSHPNWLTQTTRQYDPQGRVYREMNMFGIKTTVKHTVDGSNVSLVANNSSYETVEFLSFEDIDDNPVPHSSQLTEEGYIEAHTGKNSLSLAQVESKDIATIDIDDQVIESGLNIKLWVSTDDPLDPTALISGQLNSTGYTNSITFTPVSRNGRWQLFEANIVTGLPLIETQGIIVSLTNAGPNTIYVDDVLMRPLNSKTNAYVYNDKNRLIAVFDDNLFATIYQYGDDGSLSKIRKETERGTATISDGYSNIINILKHTQEEPPGGLIESQSGNTTTNSGFRKESLELIEKHKPVIKLKSSESPGAKGELLDIRYENGKLSTGEGKLPQLALPSLPNIQSAPKDSLLPNIERISIPDSISTSRPNVVFPDSIPKIQSLPLEEK